MEQEDRDLLIRIDTRQEVMGREIGAIKLWLSNVHCQTHAEKLSTLERITWGAVVVSLGAIIKSFWSVFSK